MSVKQILPGLYQITTTGINVFLIDSGELILVDVGPPNNAKAIRYPAYLGDTLPPGSCWQPGSGQADNGCPCLHAPNRRSRC